MDLERLHSLVRQLADGDAASKSGAGAARFTEAERRALRTLRRRVRRAGSFAALAPVSGTTIWTAPPLARAAE